MSAYKTFFYLSLFNFSLIYLTNFMLDLISFSNNSYNLFWFSASLTVSSILVISPNGNNFSISRSKFKDIDILMFSPN